VDLNHARLPIPPLRRSNSNCNNSVEQGQTCGADVRVRGSRVASEDVSRIANIVQSFPRCACGWYFRKVSRSLKAHLLLVLCAFIWGTTFVVVKDALRDCSPLLFNAVRMAIAAVLLIAIFWRSIARLTRAAALSGTVVGVTMWLGYECQTTGLGMTTASKSAFLTGLSVVLVPCFLALFWRRHVNHWTLVGVAVALVGLYLMTVPATGQAGFSFAGINRGDLLTIGCAISFTFQIILLGRATQHHPFAQIVTVEIASCALLMWLSVPIAERNAFMLSTPRLWWSIAITVLLGTVGCFLIQGWAQQFTPPTHTALIFALEPVFAGVTSYVVLRERLGFRGGVGAALILGGVLLSELLGTVQHPEAELKEETA